MWKILFLASVARAAQFTFGAQGLQIKRGQGTAETIVGVQDLWERVYVESARIDALANMSKLAQLEAQIAALRNLIDIISNMSVPITVNETSCVHVGAILNISAPLNTSQFMKVEQWWRAQEVMMEKINIMKRRVDIMWNRSFDINPRGNHDDLASSQRAPTPPGNRNFAERIQVLEGIVATMLLGGMTLLGWNFARKRKTPRRVDVLEEDEKTPSIASVTQENDDTYEDVDLGAYSSSGGRRNVMESALNMLNSPPSV